MKFAMLKKTDNSFLEDLKNELEDTRNKRQIFRSETQMRYSVLNDGVHPNNASKYWQCVTEQNVMYDNLVRLSFDYRELEIKIKKAEIELANTEDPLDKELCQIKLERLFWDKADSERIGRDRVREIKKWSELKAEFDDGTFDTEDAYVEQDDILRMRLENRRASLTPGSSQAEVLNVLGPLTTINKGLELNGAEEIKSLSD